MRYELVIFDFDGTLADTFPWFIDAVNRLAHRHRFSPIDEAELVELRGLDARHVMDRLGVPSWKLPTIARDLRQAMAADSSSIRLFDGVDDMLARTHEAGIAAAIVTSNSEANVRAIIGEQTMRRLSAVACGTSLFGKGAKLRRILAQRPAAPAKVLCVGDELRDLYAARRAGLAFGAVAWGYTRLDALVAHRPDAVFTTMSDLVAQLLSPA